MDKLIRVFADDQLVADKVVFADNAQLRRTGVLGRASLGIDEGVLLVMPKRTGLSLVYSIHMFGVPFELAVVWLDRTGQIIHLKMAKPGRMYFPPGFCTDTMYVLEVHPEHFNLLQISTLIHWEGLNA